MATQMQPVIRDKQNARRYAWGEGCFGWHLVEAPDVSVIHELMPAGTCESSHLHRLARQVFIVLEGELTIEVRGEQRVLGPQASLEVAPGTPHTVRNTAVGDSEFLVISTPPSHGDRVDL